MYRCDVCGATDPKKHEPWCEQLRALADKVGKLEDHDKLHSGTTHALADRIAEIEKRLNCPDCGEPLETISHRHMPAHSPDTILPEHAHRVETPDAQQDTCPVCGHHTVITNPGRWCEKIKKHEWWCTKTMREDHRKAREYDRLGLADVKDVLLVKDGRAMDEVAKRIHDEHRENAAIAERAREVAHQAESWVGSHVHWFDYILHGGDDDE